MSFSRQQWTDKFLDTRHYYLTKGAPDPFLLQKLDEAISVNNSEIDDYQLTLELRRIRIDMQVHKLKKKNKKHVKRLIRSLVLSALAVLIYYLFG